MANQNVTALTPEQQVQDYIDHHVLNTHEWSLPFLPAVPLPDFLSLHALMIVLSAVFMFLLFGVAYRHNARVPSGITNFLEFFVLFVRDEIAVKAMGKKDGRSYTPFFCTMFFMILFLNLMGLVPLFAGATGNISVNLGYALITVFMMTFWTFYRNGIKGFVRALIPEGVPFPINGFIFLIEFLSIFVKAFALTVRLCANMVAGHIVILSLIGLLALNGLTAAPVFSLIIFIYFLKIMVAVLQAYIFTMFSATFIGLMHNPDH